MISVVTPCYNCGNTIVPTLESLKRQKYPDWECILVNDGSSDDTIDIIYKYADTDKRFRVYEQPHQGVSKARNLALANVSGRYLFFLDADDLISHDLFAEFTDVFKSISYDKVILYCGCRIIDESGSIVGTWPLYRGINFMTLSEKNQLPIHTVMMPTDVIDQVGYFDNSLSYCEDWDFFLRIARCGYHFRCIDKYLASYCQKENSASRNIAGMYRGELKVLKRILQRDERVKNPAKEYSDGLSRELGHKRLCQSEWYYLGIFLSSQNIDLFREALKNLEDLQNNEAAFYHHDCGLFVAAFIEQLKTSHIQLGLDMPKFFPKIMPYLVEIGDRLDYPSFIEEFLNILMNPIFMTTKKVEMIKTSILYRFWKVLNKYIFWKTIHTDNP